MGVAAPAPLAWRVEPLRNRAAGTHERRGTPTPTGRHHAATDAARRERNRRERRAGFRGTTVLVVDDERDLRLLARTILEPAGYHIIEAADGAEALQVLVERSHEIDVVLLDLVMPVLDGFEVLEWLRSNPTISDGLDVVVFTAHHDLVEELEPARREHLLPKPFSAGDLVAVIDRAAA